MTKDQLISVTPDVIAMFTDQPRRQRLHRTDLQQADQHQLQAGATLSSWLKHGNCSMDLMPISIASAQPIGAVIHDGVHQPFRASACSIKALDYDESQMRDTDHERRQQRSELEYDC